MCVGPSAWSHVAVLHILPHGVEKEIIESGSWFEMSFFYLSGGDHKSFPESWANGRAGCTQSRGLVYCSKDYTKEGSHISGQEAFSSHA